MTISIVTGGAGFIGSHIVEKLKRLDHMVVVVDNEYSDNDNFHWRKDTLNVNIDITDYKALNEVEPPFIIFEDDCKAKNFRTIIDVPDDSDAVYLGISSWGRMNSHSGPCVQYEDLNGGLLRIYNMLSAHSVLYLDEEYISLCSKIAHQSFDTAQHQDIGFAEIQRYYNVYAFDDPLFYQTSSNGTDDSLTSYPTIEVIQPNRNFWKPTVLY